MERLRPSPHNSRTHSPKQIRQIADSIDRFGFTNPILIGDDHEVIGGHARLAAAKLLGLERVPTIRLSGMSRAEKRAYMIADNRLAERAGWDRRMLALEFAAIAELDSEFDLELTGFEIEDIELILDGAASDPSDDADDEMPMPGDGPAVCEPGDLWQLGPHRLYCGDATQWVSYRALMGAERARLVCADAPYNLRISGFVSGRGKHREFVQGSGEMSEAEYIGFLSRAMARMARASLSGSLHYLFIDWRHLFEMLSAGRSVYDELKNVCVWAKTAPSMGSLYRSQHELICVFKRGHRPHINNVELGRHGRSRSNVWQYPGVNSFTSTRADELTMHPTVKPLSLVSDVILDASDRGDIILDPFGGSGTTLIAAEQTGRICRMMELDPLYCDVILRRFAKSTGVEPVHGGSGKTFAQLAAEQAEARHG
ncbi:MAG TPA: DNA methyltransferase [Sphingomicrobium sp.]|nr:DNA methyltransferase [Sphingomicrobium sp.]